jgi:hypothetical protein
MRAEERYPYDYQVVMLLETLVKVMNEGDEELFAAGLAQMWYTLTAKMPRQLQMHPVCLVLDTYFKMHGDLRKGLRLQTQAVVDRVGYQAHTDAVERLSRKAGLIVEELLANFQSS